MRYADSLCTYTEYLKNGKQFYCFTGTCIITKKQYSVEVPAEGLYQYRHGKKIQDALAELSVGDREFLMSGISPEGWQQGFSEEQDEDETQGTTDTCE